MKTQRRNSLSTMLKANGAKAVALSLLISSAISLRAVDGDYVAHEWGTFTSIQGGDGVLLDWNGIATADLPPFVYNWQHAGLGRFNSAYLFKGAVSGLQRMETPVIYFYTEKSLKLDVSVEFPKGQITEWFPQAAKVGPSVRSPGRFLSELDAVASKAGLNPNPPLSARLSDPPVTNSIVEWKDFAVLPVKQNAKLRNQLPVSPSPSHYFAARETDAAFVRVDSMEPTNSTPEIEKFLFYRGVGNFPSPLKVTMNETGLITVSNSCDAALRHLFAIEIRGDAASLVSLGTIEPGQTRETRIDLGSPGKPLPKAVKQLRRQMVDALVAEGLYRVEAEAMVNTWRDAWFEDQGIRVLYTLPRAWTDAILPIAMNPSPKELVRVMVGRAEVISPEMERDLAKCIEKYRQSDPTERAAAVNEFRALKLGRFAQAAIRLVATHRKENAYYYDGTVLMAAAARLESSQASVSEPARPLVAKGR